MSVHFFLSKSLAATVPNVPLRWSFAPSASFSFGFKPTIVVIPAFIFLVNSVSLVCESSFNISGVCSSFSLPTDEKHNFSNYLFLLSRVWQRSRFDYLLSFSCLGLQVLLDLFLSLFLILGSLIYLGSFSRILSGFSCSGPLLVS